MERKLYQLLLRTQEESPSEEEKQLLEQSFQFQPFFSSRVMARLEKAYKEEREWLPGLTFAFSRVALPVLAATIVFLAVIVFKDQTVSLDTLIGTSEISVEDIVGNVFVSL
ncbi:MAG: hypothetical protein R3D00_17765 [Bacteroidia bacterium]